METRDTGTQHKLRMPPDLKEKLFASAKEMNRSLNAEIVARLEKSFGDNVTAFLVQEHMKAAKENHDLLRKQIKVSNFIMQKLAEKLPDEDPLKMSVLQMLNNE